jgi:hypothetical protein
MQRLIIGLLCLVCVTTVVAQDVKQKEIKLGTIVRLDVYTQGQYYPLSVTVSSIASDELILSYEFIEGITGKFINGKGNLEKGLRFNWDQPVAGEERKVPDQQTLLMFSRTAVKDLKTNKKCSFNDQAIILKDLPAGQELSASGTQIDVIYAESEDGNTKYWILNNDAYPVLLKLSGNPGGIDIEVKEFK